ncbi:PREDICTED: transcription factor grauzone-like [Rhagoletis zephyria]|uniref:transcription factor grauzone-like n=1 Tax=Rhagoletis zephyria TaxID=28612 RepID=UPI00081162C9|nr:PREDICTED: transcription factor grauzone-like [Rhagoletis zephyria]
MFYDQSCALCLQKSGACDNQVNFDSDDEQSVNVREVIEKHFKEELSMLPFLSNKVVCIECWESLHPFHEFYVRVQKAHLAASSKLKTLQELEIVVTESKSETDALENLEKHLGSEPLSLRECAVDTENLISPCSAISEDSQQLSVNLEMQSIRSETMQDGTIESNYVPQLSEDEENNSGREEDDIGCRIPPKRKRLAKRTKKIRLTEQENDLKKRNTQRNKTAESDEFIAQNFKLKCCICCKSLTDFRELKSHFREEHQTNGYVKCCGKKLLNRGVLVDHIQVHINPEYFKCKHCEKVLCDRSGLEAHEQFFHGSKERIYQCDICRKSFFSRKILNRHHLIHAPKEQKNIKCPQCDKRFCNQYMMKQHLALVHLNLYAKICDICGKSLNGKQAFRWHQEEHAGVSRSLIKCTLCNTELKTKYGLARHMKTMHTEEYQTPQACPICFKVSPTLRAHKSHIEYMHSAEKKHVCKLCDKAFKLPKCLREHMATHTGEVLYTCTFCPQTFNSKSNMYSHRKRKHPKEWSEKCAKKTLLVE